MFHQKSSRPLSPVEIDIFVFHQIPVSNIYLVQPLPVFVDQRPDVKTKPPFLKAVEGAGRHRTPLYDLELVDTIYFSEAVTTRLPGFSWSIWVFDIAMFDTARVIFGGILPVSEKL